MADIVATATFKGRTVAIHAPSSTQMAAWQRVANQAAKLGGSDGELSESEIEEFKTLLDRLLRIALSMFADDKDKDWFVDLSLDGEISDQDLLDLFTKATEGLRANASKGPAKKAARRTRASA